MSVINQMLRDLDRRTMPADRAVYASRIDRPSNRRIAVWGVVGVLVVGIASGTTVMWWNSSTNSRPLVTTQVETKVVNEPANSVAEKPAPDVPAGPVIEAAATAELTAPMEAVRTPEPKAPSSKPDEPLRPAAPKVVKQQIAPPVDDPLEKLLAGINKESLSPAPSGTAPVSLAIQPPVDTTRAPAPKIDKRILGDEAMLTAESAFRRAALLIDQGRLTEAQDRLRDALELDARHEPARQTLAALLLESKAYDAAESVLAAGLQRNPAQTNFALALSRLHLEQGNVQAAISVLREHEQFAIGHPEYRAFAAALHGRSGAHAKAISEYEAALRLAPRMGPWWVGLGLAHEAEDRIDAAMAAYRNARATGSLSANLSEFVERKLQRKLPN
jgi:MSHA biogenesis protein MshN